MSFSASDAAPAQPRRRWIWWVLGGCGTVIVVVIAAFLVLGIMLSHLASSTESCLPASFPVAPSLTKVTAIKLADTCTTAYRTHDTPAQVETFYATSLGQGGWEVVGQSGQTIRFERRGDASESGSVTVTHARGRTEVAVVLRNG